MDDIPATSAFRPPTPPTATYRDAGRMRLGDYVAYFQAMSRNPLEIWSEAHFELDMSAISFLGRSSLLINDPDAIRYCFVTNAANYRMQAVRQSVLRPVLRDGLLTAEGETWKATRHALSPVFTPRRVNAFAPTILHCSEAARDQYRDRAGDILAISDEMNRLTLHVLMETLFSGDRALDRQAFTDGITELVEIGGIPHLFDLLRAPTWLPRVGHARVRKVAEGLRRQVITVATARRAQPDAETCGRSPDFLDLLLNAGLDDTGVVDNLMTFLAAGHETTARALGWTLYLLSQSPDHRARLETEINAAPLSDTDPAQWADQLPFLVAVINESLRLYPSAPILSRTSIAADTVCGHPIEAGTDVLVATWLLHRQRDRWPDADHFRPERFEPANAASIDRFSFIPFGLGPRVCIGARFAMMEMVILLATLLKDLRFEFRGEQHPVPVMRITLQPDVEIPMEIVVR